MSKTTVIDMIKDSPQVSVTALSVAGVPLDTWILVATATWAVVRVLMAVAEFYWKWKDRREQGK